MSAREERLRRIETTIAAMPPLTREVLLLSRVAALEHRAIAQRLGIAETIVRRELALGLAHLDRALERDGER
jgi:DNA-directed RNA polymerase specialized sigma24 family protein